MSTVAVEPIVERIVAPIAAARNTARTRRARVAGRQPAPAQTLGRLTDAVDEFSERLMALLFTVGTAQAFE